MHEGLLFKRTTEAKNKQNHVLKYPVLACAGLHVNFRQDSSSVVFMLLL